MPCFLAVIALLFPRLVILYLWFFTTWLHAAFDTILWPIVGFLFAPFTMLWYSVVINHYGGEWGLLQIAVLVVAFITDISPGGVKKRKK